MGARGVDGTARACTRCWARACVARRGQASRLATPAINQRCGVRTTKVHARHDGRGRRNPFTPSSLGVQRGEGWRNDALPRGACSSGARPVGRVTLRGLASVTGALPSLPPPWVGDIWMSWPFAVGSATKSRGGAFVVVAASVHACGCRAAQRGATAEQRSLGKAGTTLGSQHTAVRRRKARVLRQLLPGGSRPHLFRCRHDWRFVSASSACNAARSSSQLLLSISPCPPNQRPKRQGPSSLDSPSLAA